MNSNDNKASSLSTKTVFKYGEDDETIVDAVATTITSNADVASMVEHDDDDGQEEPEAAAACVNKTSADYCVDSYSHFDSPSVSKGTTTETVSCTAELNKLLGISHFQMCTPHKARQQDKVYEEREKSCWILHLRTGIFYPKGHEWVMNEVPDGAAIFASSYWLRNSDMYRV
ncbi:hypothetical protein Tco_0554724 [Tanacetum coccineum]